MAKKKPTGFVAVCQCGNTVGAIDYKATLPEQAGKLLAQWLVDGCTITPMFKNTWSVQVESCECEYPKIKEKDS